MKRPTLNFDFVLSALTAIDDDGFLSMQPDANGEEQSGAGAVPLHHPFGFRSRPLDPDADATGQPTIGCEALVAEEGEQRHAFLAQDPRITPKLPPEKKGGSTTYGATGAFSQFDGETGAWTLYVPYAFDGNGVAQKAHSITVDVATGNESIVVSHGEGMGLTMFQGGAVLKNAAGDAYLEVNAGGVTLNGNTTLNGGIIAGNVAAAQPVALYPGFAAYVAAVHVILGKLPAPPTPADLAPLNAAFALIPTSLSTKVSASP